MLSFGDNCSAGELLRLIALRKQEIKREKTQDYFYKYGVWPEFDFGFEIAEDGMWGEIHGYYIRLEKLFSGKVRTIDRKRVIHRANTEYWD